ncbi:hypothetical protein EBM89_04775 [Cellulomonas triticagri]|uniref:Uncharacterized protein n=1 Tax=Cellulomonas triticagri TaxID=2483352 RepID=A0A3M2JHM2_9CELL|nr:hypothetical protein EBM89_04775 [Cellulomonas triticagri]
MTSVGGFHVRTELGAMANELRGASDGIDAPMSGAPGAPDGGAATGTLADLLARLVAAADNLSMDAREASDRLDASRDAYAQVDTRAAAALDGLWRD